MLITYFISKLHFFIYSNFIISPCVFNIKEFLISFQSSHPNRTYLNSNIVLMFIPVILCPYLIFFIMSLWFLSNIFVPSHTHCFLTCFAILHFVPVVKCINFFPKIWLFLKDVMFCHCLTCAIFHSGGLYCSSVMIIHITWICQTYTYGYIYLIYRDACAIEFFFE